MSYSFSVAGPSTEVFGLLTTEVEAQVAMDRGENTEPTVDHLRAIETAALGLVEALGPEVQVSLSISGHAEKDHGPGESLSLSIYTAALPVAAPAEG